VSDPSERAICGGKPLKPMIILNPKPRQDIPALSGAKRLAGLGGAVVGFIDNSKQNADLFIERLGELLRDQYGVSPDVKVRKFAPKDELSDRELRELVKCAAVVQCYGD
jgi:hypothetical protein